MPIPGDDRIAPPKSAKVRIYEAMRDWIIDGTLTPGEKILDNEIAAHFSVSRTPVREAMQLLADQKLIEIYPGRESRVTGIGNVDIAQIYRMLAELHSLALDFSYEKIDEHVITELQQINVRFAQATDQRDPQKSRSIDKEFHDIFVDLSGNAFLKDFTETLACHTARVENIYYDRLAGSKDSVDEHNRIIDALKANDRQKARSAMYNNWMHTLEIIRSSETSV